MRVTVYGTTHCGFCRRAEALLAQKGIGYRYVDLTGDPAARAAASAHAGGRQSVPMIFVDGVAIGGYRELTVLGASGELERMLAAPPPVKTTDDDGD